MSWRKSRPQPFAVPLDALVKEKENANRPVAARSAGTVGKWGITSFTSIRNSTYGIQAYSPQHHDSTSPGFSPRAGVAPTNMAVSPPTHNQDAPLATPKPKKFFKSRNVVPVSDMQAPDGSPPPMYMQPSYHHQLSQHPAAVAAPSVHHTQTVPKEKISLKINKKKLKATLKIAPVQPPTEKPAKAPKKSKKRSPEPDESVVVKAAKSAPTPTRVMGRARKQVNYNEEKEEVMSRRALAAREAQIIAESAAIAAAAETSSVMNSPTAENRDAVDTAQKNQEHPPIVLRISKGTSRLISTDSEDINNSSPTRQLTPLQTQNDIVLLTPTLPAETVGPTQSTAELLAVLSQPSLPPQPILPAAIATSTIASDHHSELQTTTVVEPVEKRAKAGIKIKIKTDFIRAYEASQALKQQQQPPKSKTPPLPANKRATRASKRTQKQSEAIEQPEPSPPPTPVTITNPGKSPLPGSENYDLYRSLTSHSEERDFDSQSSILGSVSSPTLVRTAPTITSLNNCVLNRRSSSDATSDLENLSQVSSLAAQPSELDTSIEDAAMIDTEPNAVMPPVQIEPETVPDEPEVMSDEPEVAPEDTGKRVTRRSARGGASNCAVEPQPITKRKAAAKANAASKKSVPPPPSNGTSVEDASKKPPVRSYTRKRKANQINETANNVDVIDDGTSAAPAVVSLSDQPEPENNGEQSSPDESEYKIRNKYKRAWHNNEKSKTEESSSSVAQTDGTMAMEVASNLATNSMSAVNNNTEKMSVEEVNEEDKPSVKLVISKKKGSIFKSRALVPDSGGDKKRALYKHKWDDDIKDKTLMPDQPVAQPNAANAYFDDFDDGEEEPSVLRTTRKPGATGDEIEEDAEEKTTVSGEKKKFYTVVRNVKKAHQIQEIGEFQEMDDDVEYILDALQSHNPISTRCLSAIQLASKCMTPAFRMHVRAHGTVTKFFKALQDANKDQSLGLCTATVMFVLSQDNLNMDLDRDSLELMLNLLESDVSHRNALDDCGLSKQQLMRNKQKVRELCEEIKTSGKAIHLNLDNITVGTLAMETLLSMTSKRAGEWFKEELRTLGGLEHIIKTICECARQISDYVVDWTEVLLDKLRKIERCLRVLENVSQMNEENQNYILTYNNGQAVDTLVKLYKLFDSEIALYPTTDQTPKENPGVVLREALVPTLKVLINLAHPFNSRAMGSCLLGQKAGIFDTSLHILLQAPQYVPERCIFELSILVLLLLINLTMHTTSNRNTIMNANEPSDFGNQFDRFPAIKALIEYFYRRELLARQVEQTTDDILDNPKKSERKLQSQEEVEETVTKLLQKAGHHMEHTMIASYVCLLVGHLVTNNEENEQKIRMFLKDKSFHEMIDILQKYYNFMNLTASSEATIVAHVKQTKQIIEYFQQCDSHSNNAQRVDISAVATPQPTETRNTYANTRNAAGTSTYGSR